jgi:hypothetical protein
MGAQRAGPGFSPGDIDALTDAVRTVASRTVLLRAEFRDTLGDAGGLRTLLERNPIAAWTGGDGTGGVSYFSSDTVKFRSTPSVKQEHRAAIQELTRELVEWRLSEYLDRVQS